tara:strand:+ start:586 stop:1140 length:555 start_codon:yes stop_codon:yes gene_type:complete
MKKTLTLLTTLFLTTSAFASDIENFIDDKKEELVQKSESQALNILKCDRDSSLDFLVKDNEWSCKFSTYTLKNIEQSGGFKVKQTRKANYVSSITITEGQKEPFKQYDDVDIEESLDVLYQVDHISFNYYNTEILSMDKFEINGSESVFLPQTRTINLNSTLAKDSFNISASDDSLLILFWRGE